MKIKLLIAWLLMAVTTFSQIDLKSIKANLPKGIDFKYDMFDEIGWVSTDYYMLGTESGDASTTIYAMLYYGIDKEGKQLPLRMKIKYKSPNWMFSNEIIFLCGSYSAIKEGLISPIKVSLASDPINQVHEGGVVTETFDMEVDTELLKLVEYYHSGGTFTSTKLKGDEFEAVFNTFGKQISKHFSILYQHYLDY